MTKSPRQHHHTSIFVFAATLALAALDHSCQAFSSVVWTPQHNQQRQRQQQQQKEQQRHRFDKQEERQQQQQKILTNLDTNIAPTPTVTTASKVQHRETYDLNAWFRGWHTVEQEECYEMEGTFPTDLCGTFFQNGPAKFKIGDELVIHPFDADGMIRAVTFDQGKAWFRNRFVRTPGFIEEERYQKVCYRGVFGTAKNKGNFWSNVLDLRRKNVANTNVLFHQNKLYALWDAGAPVEMDPCTLETKGENARAFDSDRYAAHYKVDTKSNTLCNFALYFAYPNPTNTHRLQLMEHDLDTGKVVYEKSYRLPGIAIGHDMAITEKYFCFFRFPATFDPVPFILGKKGPAQCFEWDAKASTAPLYLVPRGPKQKGQSQEPIRIDLPPLFCFHTANAFDDPETGEAVIDVLMADKMYMTDTNCEGKYPDKLIWESVDIVRDIAPFTLTRYRVNPETRQLVSMTPLSASGAASVDFPVLHDEKMGQPYQYAYVAATATQTTMGPWQGLAKIDVEQASTIEKWIPEPHEFLSEVAFCPRDVQQDGQDNSKEDDGYLMGFLYNGKEHSSSLCIFDAANVAQGPIARAKLRHAMPHSLHGSFAAGFAPALTDQVRQSFGKL